MITQYRDGDVAVIEIDRHERRNALDMAHCDDLRAALTEQALQAARVIVITGAGSSFSPAPTWPPPTTRRSAIRCTRCWPRSPR